MLFLLLAWACSSAPPPSAPPLPPAEVAPQVAPVARRAVVTRWRVEPPVESATAGVAALHGATCLAGPGEGHLLGLTGEDGMIDRRGDDLAAEPSRCAWDPLLRRALPPGTTIAVVLSWEDPTQALPALPPPDAALPPMEGLSCVHKARPQCPPDSTCPQHTWQPGPCPGS